MNNIEINKPIQFGVIALIIVGAVGYGLINAPQTGITSAIEAQNQTEIVQQKAEEYNRAKPLTNPTGYINTDNVSIEDNIGEKVILLDMWTYSCINCQRTFPHLKEWHQKYRDDGLLIIGNHAPEFEFEKDRSNVEDAVEKFNITYPVVMDNDYGTWNAYNNRYWPQKYLIGVDGFIRYEHIGEGRYEATEQKIRELLKELKKRKGLEPTLDEDSVPNFVDRELDSTDVNTDNVETPEIYFGAWRNKELENGPQETEGMFNFTAPDELKDNKLYLDGEWNITREKASATPGSSIVLDYTAKNVNMVLDGQDARVKVYQDGELVGEAGGESAHNSTVEVNSEQLYRIIENEDYGNHKLRLQVEEGQLDAYTFTFG